MTNCNTCGAQINNNERFCPQCGAVQCIETYTDAVIAAIAGNSLGFEFLYNKTATDKYYVALKYMKNEEDANDVLQDAYLKAWTKLETLDDPEKFPAWIGMIVANTAKNVLQKKNPMLFSDLENDEGEIIEFQIEDESLDANPEISVTNQERSDIINTMLNSLSEEQRLCITMFYLEERSIKEIAEILECSENTVKSRLNYGRKNLAIVGEEMKQNGYQFFGMAPLPLLILLIQAEAKALGINFGIGGTVATSTAIGSAAVVTSVSGGAAVGGTAGGTAVGGAAVSGTAVAQGAVGGSASGASTIGVAANTGAATATSTGVGAGTQVATASSVAGTTVAKTAAGGFLKTIAGKVIVGLGAAAVVGVGAVAVHNVVKDKTEATETTTEVTTEYTEIATATDTTAVEATETDAIDERALLQTYYEDVLVAEYGLMQEHQTNKQLGDAIFDGIYCSDIDDYNNDGILDLFVCIYDHDDSYKIEGVSRQHGEYKELYSIRDGQVVLLSRDESLVWKNMLDENKPDELLTSREFLWKVKVDSKVYLVKYTKSVTPREHNATVEVFEFVDSKLQINRHVENGPGMDCKYFYWAYEYVDGEAQDCRWLYGPEAGIGYYLSDEYENVENITEEDFFAEIGIMCNLDLTDEYELILTFEHENKLLYEIYNGGKDSPKDTNVYAIVNHIVDIDDSSSVDTEETFHVDYSDILLGLKNNGTLSVQNETVTVDVGYSAQYEYQKATYSIFDINGDGYDELIVLGITDCYVKDGGPIKGIFVYGYNPNTKEIEFKFQNECYGDTPEFYVNGYIVCTMEYGEDLSHDVYSYNSDTASYEVVFSEDARYAGPSIAPPEVYSQDLNGNSYVIGYMDENSNYITTDDTYPQWHTDNLSNVDKYEIPFNYVSDYEG